MEYINKNMTSYNLHLIKTKRFKTITIRVTLRNKVKKEEITFRNFLANFLMSSTDTYKTKRELVLKTEELYGIDVYTKSYRTGKFNIISFNANFLNEKYTEDGMLEESVKFLSDIIFNPNFKDIDKFNKSYNYLYKDSLEFLKSFKEHKDSYSIVRMLEEMSNKEYGYRDIGYLEDLEKIDRNSLIKYYNKIINNSLVDIYVLGDINDNVVGLIDRYFKFKTIKNKNIVPIIKHNDFRSRIKVVKEKDDNSQSKLVVGCKLKNLSEFERNYVLTLYNMILGGTSESKFFQIIREKNSLAYYVNSHLYKLDNLLLIRAGISKDNYDKVIKLIKKLMKDITIGKFTDKEINVARENYISLLNEIYDNPSSMIEVYLAKDLLNLGDIEERKEKIKEVTKEDIIKLSKKVSIDTIFLLEGDQSYE